MENFFPVNTQKKLIIKALGTENTKRFLFQNHFFLKKEEEEILISFEEKQLIKNKSCMHIIPN